MGKTKSESYIKFTANDELRTKLEHAHKKQQDTIKCAKIIQRQFLDKVYKAEHFYSAYTDLQIAKKEASEQEEISFQITTLINGINAGATELMIPSSLFAKINLLLDTN